jgi:YD repeat-containing protein
MARASRRLVLATPLLLLGLWAAGGGAAAQTQRHYDAQGRLTGSSERLPGGIVRHYDAQGRLTGSSERSTGGTVRHYDAQGRGTGRSTKSLD